MPERPSGTVTFLFTDVEGSTGHWERHPAAMRPALTSHDELLRSAIGAAGGVIFATGGDGFAAVFARADAAVDAAKEAQRSLTACTWPDDLTLRVRMGLHTGEGHERDGDYFGPAVNRAARVMDAANGTQILLSSSTREVVGHELGQATTLVDLGAQELRDVVEPVRLYRLEDPSFESDQRPPRTGSVRAGNLPSAAGVLLGRDPDVDGVIEDLEAARLVTLTGVGGIGKTRLALEVGRRLQPRQPDGAWFVALDTVDAPENVCRALLSTLAIEAQAAHDLDALIAGLRFRHALVILDNCEHVLDAAAEATRRIVATCPNVRILATSRTPLDVDGERTRRTPSLDVDDDGPAVRLFWLRAEEAGAELDRARDGAAITRICRRLDGIPLAIELAAARARSLRPAEIADRLDDMFSLLTGGRRARVERHRTLRAALDWSLDLLGQPEQALLARLSIFSGSFSLAAVEAVGGGDPVASGVLVDLIDELVARSLVVPVDGGDESRFRLLEPVRQLAAEELVSRGEFRGVREAHTQWYFELLVRLDERWRGGDDQWAWPIAARELPNLRAAFDHLVETGRTDDAQRFAVAGFGPIDTQIGGVAALEWTPRAASLAPDHVGPSTGAMCAVAAWGPMVQADLDAVAEWLRRGADAIDRGSHDDGLLVSTAISHVGFGGQLAVSDAFVQRSLDGAMASSDLHRQAWVFTYLRPPEEAIAVAQRLGNTFLVALARWAAVLAQPVDEEAWWEALETFWEAAQRCHSFIVRSHAALLLGAAHIRAGGAVDGLLLLRAPARDWLLRGDIRVWDVVHTIATGLALGGDVTTATRLYAAIGERRLSFVPEPEREQLRSLLSAGLGEGERGRLEREGRTLDAGAAVAAALQAIEVLATADSTPTAVLPAEVADLTARQREVAALVARGLTNKQIAQRLGISRFTAETHVRNILERLGAASRSEIATWATQQP